MTTARDLLAAVRALHEHGQLDHLDALIPQIDEVLAPPPGRPKGVCRRHAYLLPARHDGYCAQHLDERQTGRKPVGT